MRPGHLCCLILGTALLAACSTRPADVDFIYINGAEPESLDPHIITGQTEGRLCSALFEGLTTRDAAGHVVPGIAERWEISEDGILYTFHLRDNARWSNGDAVTAADFVYSWRRVLEPATASRYAEILFVIRNAEAYQSGKLSDFSQVGIRQTGPLTLEVELTSPAAYFPELTAFVTYSPVHRPTIEQYGERWIRPGNMVSNGAYKLTGWRINDRVQFEANPHYWRADTVAMRRIDALTLSAASTAFNLYATGQVDLIMDKGLIPPLLIEELRKRPDLHTFTYLATYFYRFNTTKPPFDNPLVRRAFTAAIDRDAVVQRITRAGEHPTSSLTPPGIPGYEPPHGVHFDPEQARIWLAEAGFPDPASFPRVELLYNKTELNEQIATEIQSHWRTHLGIRVELRNQEWATYLRSMNELDYDIVRSAWIGDYNDPNTFLDCFVTGRGNNRTGWSNPTYDQLLAEANRHNDPSERFRLMQKAETILTRDQAPIAPIYNFVGMMLYDASRLGGIQGNVIDDHPLRTLYWKK